MLTQPPRDNWIHEYRAIWNRKAGLRDYYTTQIFDRVIENLVEGEILQLGAGPGHFSEYHPGMVNSDITDRVQAANGDMVNSEWVDIVADVHDLQFSDASFSNIVGIDVLHHFAKPALALRECARVLRPGGRLVFVEPWAGPLGWLFFRFLHHEDCSNVPDPWNGAFPNAKNPMDGNAMIPIILFHHRALELGQHLPDIRMLSVEPFGSLSNILTGGFQKFGAPAPVIRFMYRLENMLPRQILAIISMRAIFVMEKSPHKK